MTPIPKIYGDSVKFQPWIYTATGGKFHFLSGSSDEVKIEDIAVALSRMPRWAGHCTSYMSVAQHSIYTSQLVAEWNGSLQDQLIALLHDATEAYMCDIPKPLKTLMPIFAEIEHKVWNKISRHFFGKTTAITPIVKQADGVMLSTEARDLFSFDATKDWGWKPPAPWDKKLIPVGPVAAYNHFKARFEELTDGQ